MHRKLRPKTLTIFRREECIQLSVYKAMMDKEQSKTFILILWNSQLFFCLL